MHKSISKFWSYHNANPQVAEAMIEYAKQLIHTKRRMFYGMQSITERVRWDWLIGVVKLEDGFRINNDLNAAYSRFLMMTEPELFGFFETRMSHADTELIVNGECWKQFLARKAAEATEQDDNADGFQPPQSSDGDDSPTIQ